MIYCSSFCNRGHKLSNGMPVDHQCYVLDPRLLQKEREGEMVNYRASKRFRVAGRSKR